jgi:hypothetical protein
MNWRTKGQNGRTASPRRRASSSSSATSCVASPRPLNGGAISVWANAILVLLTV